MSELVLDGVNGRRITLSEPGHQDQDGIWSYRAVLSLPDGSVETKVWDIGDGLVKFLRELADAWQGFEGTKEFSSLEGQLVLSCRHDGRGTVECTLSLGRLEPPVWNLTAEIDFGAGAHLDRIARDAAGFVAHP
jgi:Family of unknown function (DUF6228)